MPTRAFRGCRTKQMGDASEALVLSRLVEAGLTVLVPWGDNTRFDLTAMCGDVVLRIQCKTGRQRNGYVDFIACGVGRTAIVIGTSRAKSIIMPFAAWRLRPSTWSRTKKLAVRRRRTCDKHRHGLTRGVGARWLASAGRPDMSSRWSSNPGCGPAAGAGPSTSLSNPPPADSMTWNAPSPTTRSGGFRR